MEMGPVSIHFGITTDIRQSVSWIQSLKPQMPYDCFEALKAGGKINDPSMIIEACELLAHIWETWLYPDEFSRVVDEEGTLVFADYWSSAAGWVEAHMQPSELRELLNERRDRDAERRLSTYFFGDKLWIVLPERVKNSLVSADRDWFSGASARTESILNELRIATEELLLCGLWKPLEQWVVSQGGKCGGRQDFLNFKAELASKGWVPDLFHLERACRMSITDAFLKNKGVPPKERRWFLEELPRSLSRLRRERRRAEHESSNQWTRQELSKYFAEFIGIGRPGILPELCRILLFQKR